MDIREIIPWVIGFIIVVVVVILLFWGPGKVILQEIGLLGGLPKEAEEASKSNFDILVENIEKCRALTETNCLCEVFPSWPATFAKDYKLAIAAAGKRTQIDLIYGKRVHRTIALDNLLMSAQIIETKSYVPLVPTKTVYWKSEPPLFIQEALGSSGFVSIGKKEYKVVSGSLYKSEQPDMLYFLISSKPKEKLSELEPALVAIKKCGS